jgi:hypothetical protein
MNLQTSAAHVHAPGPPTFELHTLGWRSFQDLCAAVLREVWDQSAQPFADTRDAGRDGAFYGSWQDNSAAPHLPDAPYVIQCKFIARRDQTLTLSNVQDELAKIKNLVEQGLCKTYILMTNARVTGYSEQKIRSAILAQGATDALVLGGQWLNQTIALNQRLRMFVPRVYGLGDLSQILDERAYSQARALLDYLQEDLATFVVTDAYRRAARAVLEHGFCLLLGEPAVGKSVIAATLAMTALDNWGCLTIRADGPADIVTHWNPNEPNQFFWIDDAFGSVRHEQALTDDWARRMLKVMAAVKGGARVVLTSRDYIYRAARPSLKEYSYPLLREQQVVIDVADLSRQERQQIVYNHIRLGDQSKDVRTALKPHLASLADQQPFRPEIARRLGRQAFTPGLVISASAVEQFMARPNEFLHDIYQGLEPDHIGALSLVYQAGELAVPLEVTSNEGQELLTLVGSSPSGVARALTVLEGTFLRRAPRVGSSDGQEYWSFRHPTLREGFAAFVANNPNLLKLFIEGLDDNGILTQLDCGSGERRGTLVAVPALLFPMVAERVANARPEHTWGDDYWRKREVWTGFLAARCSHRFLEIYLDIDPGLIERCLGGVYSYLSSTPELRVLARLHQLGMLSEEDRERVRVEVSELAVEIPDDEWLHSSALSTLLTEEERSAILDRVRVEVVPDLGDMLDNWYMNEQGESADEYYQPLIDVLDSYKRAFDERSDREASRALEDALHKVDELRTNASHWQLDDDEEYPSRSVPEGPYSHDMSSRGMAQDRDVGGRSVFEDVDE